jgi:hypothetical protein
MKSMKVKEIKMQKNAEIADENSEAKRMKNLEGGAMRQKSFSKITDVAAQSELYLRNEPIPFAKDIWPHDWRYQFADLYYPNALGGGIYIDMPIAPYDVTMCELKHSKLHAKGVRYTYLKSNEGHAELLSRLPQAKKEMMT